MGRPKAGSDGMTWIRSVHDRIADSASAAALVMFSASVVITLFTGPADILKKQMNIAPNSDLQRFVNTVENLKGPLELGLMTVVPLGVAVGSGLVAVGQARKGLPVIASSAGAGLVAMGGMGLVE